MSVSSTCISVDGSATSSGNSGDENERQASASGNSQNPWKLADDLNKPPSKIKRTTTVDGRIYKELNQEEERPLTAELLNNRDRISAAESPVTRVKNWLAGLFGQNEEEERIQDTHLGTFKLLSTKNDDKEPEDMESPGTTQTTSL